MNFLRTSEELFYSMVIRKDSKRNLSKSEWRKLSLTPVILSVDVILLNVHLINYRLF